MDRQARVCLNGWVDEQKDSVQSWQVGVRVEIRLWKKILYIAYLTTSSYEKYLVNNRDMPLGKLALQPR